MKNHLFLEHAFPNSSNNAFNQGMSLLDYFAGQVLLALTKVVYPETHNEHNLKHVKDCYRMAAMMIEERDRILREGFEDVEDDE